MAQPPSPFPGAPPLPHPAPDRLLVCLGPGPGGRHLVTTAGRTAAATGADWFVLHVDTPARLGTGEDQAEIAQALLLAEELGAKTVRIYGLNVLEEIIGYVRQHRISTVWLGRSRSRSRWLPWPPTLSDRLRQHLEDVDIHVSAQGQPASRRQRRLPGPGFRFWRDYLLAAGGVALCTGINLALFPYFPLSNLVMFYLLAVVLIATLSERGPTIFASIASVLAFAFFFVPHYNSFRLANSEFFTTLVVMLLVTTLISNLTSRVRHQAKAARQQEWQTTALYEINQTLAGAPALADLLEAAVAKVSSLFDSRASLLLPREDRKLAVRAGTPLEPDEVREALVAQWAFNHGHVAGAGTQTRPEASWLYLPLSAPDRQVLGVLRLERRAPAQGLAVEYLRLLEALSRQIALALEREQLSRQTRQAQVQIETEQLRNTLLSSVSHDLRTPLTVIAGSASSLLEAETDLDPGTTRELVQNIYDEARRLDRLVHNLLEISRLQSGEIVIHRDWQVLEEVLGCALSQLDGQLKEHPVRIDLPRDLPLISLDAMLMERVFLNLLENAAKHTPPGTPVEISGRLENQELTLVIADRGPGLPPGQEEKIFEKFYQGAPGGARGAGLGLAICRSIVEAHQGRITAATREGGGAAFTLALPAPPAPLECPLPDLEMPADHETDDPAH